MTATEQPGAAVDCAIQGRFSLEAVDEIIKCDHQMKDAGVVPSCRTVFLMLYKVVLTFDCVKY